MTLNWLYFSEAVADKRHVIKCTRKRDNKLAGYLVFDLVGDQKTEAKIFQFRDGYVPESNKNIYLSLLSSCLSVLLPIESLKSRVFLLV